MSKGHYKYPDIERLGHDDNKEILENDSDFIVIEEKVDGGNGSFWKDESGMLYEGSRNRNLITDKDEKTFIKQRLALRKQLESKDLNPDYIYYIEWMAKHTINYTNAPEFIGYDIRLMRSANNEGEGLFLGRNTREQEFKRLGIETVPLIWKGTAGELKKLLVNELIPKSKYYDGMAEGIVIKNFFRKSRQGNHQLYAKVVREEFKECNKAIFGGVRNKDSDTNKIVEQFATEARIKKQILKLTLEQQKPLEMALMKYLPSDLIKDIFKEEFDTIYKNYKFIDFREFKKEIIPLCLKAIKQAMEERVMGESK